MIDKKLLLEKVKKEQEVYFNFLYGEDFALARCENGEIDYIVFNEMGIPSNTLDAYVNIDQFLKSGNIIRPIKLVNNVDLNIFLSLKKKAMDDRDF